MMDVLPDRPELVTADFLTEALSTAIPSVEVSRTEVLDQHSGTTGRLRLRVTYTSGPEGPASVFVKLAPFDETQRKLVRNTDMGRREARFYDQLAAETPMRAPQVYFAAHGDDPSEYCMVLEDLAASGCRFSTRLEPFGAESGLQLVEGLARTHAHFWEDPRFDEELGWIQPAMRGSYGARLVGNARLQFADYFPPLFGDLCHLFEDHHERIAVLWDEGEQTLVHGDTHAGNQFHDGTTVGLYDWAVISRSPGIRDLAIYLANSCPTDIRRSEQERWLRRYREVLIESGVDAPSFDELWLRLRRTVLYGWMSATATASMGSKWQPAEIGMTGMQRATAACADLETLEALREAL